MLGRDNTLRSELLDLVLAVLFPVLDVFVVTDTERAALKQLGYESGVVFRCTYREDNSADCVVKASSADSLLVSLGGTSLVSQDEASTNPHGRSAKHQGSSHRVAIVQATGSNHLHGQTSQGTLLALAQLGHGRNEDRSGNIASVTTTFTTLSTNDIRAGIEGLLDVLGVTDHVHVQDACSMESVHDSFGGHTDGRDEELSAAFNNNVDKFVELALSVVVAEQQKAD